jgi:hypothetical protein
MDEFQETASGDCPHCGVDWWRRCVPPRDHMQCSFYKEFSAEGKMMDEFQAELVRVHKEEVKYAWEMFGLALAFYPLVPMFVEMFTTDQQVSPATPQSDK